MEEQSVSAVEPVGDQVPATIPEQSLTPAASAAAPAVPAVAPATGLPAAPAVKTFMGIALNRAVPMLVYQMNRVGRSGMTGAALILFAGIFYFSAVLPQVRQISDLRNEIAQAQQQTGAEATPPVRLSRFVDNLPKRSALPQITGQIFKLAAATGVTLDRGHYELTTMHSGHLARYRMTFPIKGRYPAIRNFVDATLAAIPAAAIEGLRIERKNVGDDNVEVELGLAVFVRNAS
jgi:hypothetical protein